MPLTLGLGGTTGLGLEANAFEGGGILFPLVLVVDGDACCGAGDPARASSACIGLVAGESDRWRDEDFDRLEGDESDVDRDTVACELPAGVRRGSLDGARSSPRGTVGGGERAAGSEGGRVSMTGFAFEHATRQHETVQRRCHETERHSHIVRL